MFCTTILLGVIWLCLFQNDRTVNCITFNVEHNSGSTEINMYNAGGDHYCVFLPSYVNPEHVLISVPSNQKFALDGITLYDGMHCGHFELAQIYALTKKGRQAGTLTFYQTPNIATMYIETASGNMNYIHADKTNQEDASIRLYSADGQSDFCDESGILSGRGNSTWSLVKKPYTISLSQCSSLLSMDASMHWVLLANGYDETHLRNKIIYDFADAVSEKYTLAPDCAYVETYFNGEYGGLYLLCQKLDPNSTALPLDTNDFYIELTASERTENTLTAFDICSTQSVNLLYPDTVTEDRLEYLKDYIFQFQNALFSENGMDPASCRGWDAYIDLDSWARKYLIDEVFSNFDGGKASQFFLMDDSEQKLYAGHCWDYDLTLGKNWATEWSTPYSIMAQRNWYNDTSWYYALCHQDLFMERVVEIYESEFRPLLQYYMEEVIPTEASSIKSAVFSEYLRYPSLYAEISWEESVEIMENYLKQHIAFLDSLWLDNEEYCTITLQTSEIQNICVPKNTICDALPQPSDLGSSGQWYEYQTNLPFDASQVIVEDIVLIAVKASNGGSEGSQSIFSKLLQSRYLFVLASIAVLGVLFVYMTIIDILHRKGYAHK